MLKNFSRCLFVIAQVLILTISVSAQEKTEKTEKPRDVTLIGQVIDSECYLKMGETALGDDHLNCAEACAEGGVPLAFLEDGTNKVYFTANEGMSMVGTNDKLLPFLGERISIKGKLIERGGARLFVIGSIDPLK